MKLSLTIMISIHALLAESDRISQGNKVQNRHFYPRSPCGERPVQIVIVVVHALISIHALLAESDKSTPAKPFSTSISIHALLAESDTIFWRIHQGKRNISIHALLAESDNPGGRAPSPPQGISIHALLAESDVALVIGFLSFTLFLSTLSLRRATCYC